jgi:two-component system LytT family sensor kinase
MELKNNIKFILAHAVFWLLCISTPLYFNTLLFGFPIALLRSIFPMTAIIILAYGNASLIIPYLFQRKDFVWYTPFLAFMIIIPAALFALNHIFSLVNSLTDITVRIAFEISQNGTLLDTNKSDANFPASVLGLIVIFTLFVSSLYGLAIEFIKKTSKENELKATNLKNELKLLRRQINPHFLFNALNNLYAIVQLKPDKAGDFVLKLSDMLRYVTYDCQNEKVLIGKEISYLNNYVYFQKWRDQNFHNIEIDIDEKMDLLEIEPMLLIPFVENAFKHSYDNNNQARWIKVKLTTSNNQLIFNVSNSISSSNTQEDVPDEYMGIGIENVKKRLQLLYFKNHQLSIEKANDYFNIHLTLELT